MSSPFAAAGEVLSQMTKALDLEPSEKTRFDVLDLTKKAMEISDRLSCSITRGMIRKRVGALQDKFWG